MGIKNWWSNRSILLRAGMIFSLIYIIFSFIGIVSMMYFNGFGLDNFWIIFLYFPAAFIVTWIVNYPLPFFVLCLLFNIIIYFLVGCLLAWIIRKIVRSLSAKKSIPNKKAKR